MTLKIVLPDDPIEGRPSAGRRPKLSLKQRAEVRERYIAYIRNSPQRICADYGIGKTTFERIVGGKKYRDEKR